MAHGCKVAHQFAFYKTLRRLKNFYCRNKAKDVKSCAQGYTIASKRRIAGRSSSVIQVLLKYQIEDGTLLQQILSVYCQRRKMVLIVSLHGLIDLSEEFTLILPKKKTPQLIQQMLFLKILQVARNI